MSYEILERSIPINIKINNKYSNTLPTSDLNKYFFELKLTINNKEKYIRKISENKSIELIKKEDKIKYDNISDFKLTIHILPEDNVKHLYINGNVNTNVNNSIVSSDDIYLEFIRINSKYTYCKCNLLDFNRFKFLVGSFDD